MSLDTKAIRARAANGLDREMFILGGPAHQGRVVEAVIGDCVALCAEVDRLRAALRSVVQAETLGDWQQARLDARAALEGGER